MGTFSQSGRHGDGWLPVPRLVQWFATLRCGLSCPHCLAASKAGANDMDFETVRSLIDQVSSLGVEEFLLTGGEPLARPDLPQVIDYLGGKAQNYSINTAILPNADQQRALEQSPPGFVAVSLDGPKEVHDEFRGRSGAYDEAMEAIAFYKSLPNCTVAAGTTVTSFNYGALRETFSIATNSGADQWALHLPVPEGRAADRKDLFLSKKQLSWLMRFVVERRKYFDVVMADEFGYCGEWEPLLRDAPLYCGAGRTHCVVLPEGSVVPCTTLDLSTSAGNVREQSLQEIWENGFQELREWEPEKKCKRCEYVNACQGGCWLLRRHGGGCYKSVWHVPAALKTAAGIALCLGVFSTPAAAQDDQPRRQPYEIAEMQATSTERNAIDPAIFHAYMNNRWLDPATAVVAVRSFGRTWSEQLNFRPPFDKDPAAKAVKAFASKKLPRGIHKRCELVRETLKTKQRSLALSALLWRVLAEECMTGTPPAERTKAEREDLQSTLRLLSRHTELWHKEIFRDKLDPYMYTLRFDRMSAVAFMGKAGPRYPKDLQRRHWTKIPLVRDTGEERWGSLATAKPKKRDKHVLEDVNNDGDGDPVDVADDAPMTDDDVEMEDVLDVVALNTPLVFPFRPTKRTYSIPQDYLKRHSYAERMEMTISGKGVASMKFLKKKGSATAEAGDRINIHDVLVVDAEKGASIKLKNGSFECNLVLPAKAELTYADLLCLAYNQNREELSTQLRKQLRHARRFSHVDPEQNPFLAKGFLEEEARLQKTEQGEETDAKKAVSAWLTDFWLF